jgi:hypothetical protein
VPVGVALGVPLGVAVGVALGLPVALGVTVGVAVALGVALGLAVGLAVLLGVTVGDAVPLGVVVGEAVPPAVAVGVAVTEGLPVAVGLGVGEPPPVMPLSRNTWSGPPAMGMQVVFRVHVGQIPKPPMGFCHAAPLFDCTVRSLQAHAPFGINVMLAWISTQYVPSERAASLGKLTVKVLPTTENG